MSWRPVHDWKFGDKNFEAGADAMLEALRKLPSSILLSVVYEKKLTPNQS